MGKGREGRGGEGRGREGRRGEQRSVIERGGDGAVSQNEIIAILGEMPYRIPRRSSVVFFWY